MTAESTRPVAGSERTGHSRGDSPGNMTGQHTGLELAPFRAVRYNPRLVANLASVTAPPYDMIDEAARARLENADPHNIVRLILPSGETARPGERYAGGARLLRAWRDSGVLLTDPSAALYVYEQAAADQPAEPLQRGLLGALGLRPLEDGSVLPHEDVSPAVVADRLELISTTAANLEPILLQHDGDESLSAVVDGVADGAPLVETTTGDGVRHRVWRLEDPSLVAVVQARLRDRQALIADGHHRYAAYRQLQADERARLAAPRRDHQPALGASPHRDHEPAPEAAPRRDHEGSATDSGGGSFAIMKPWDYGLALLVDGVRYPLQVRAIHRVLRGVPVAEFVARLDGHATVVEAAQAATTMNLARLATIEGPAFLLAGAGRQWFIRDVDPGLIGDLVPHDRPESWRWLDTTVLHHVVLEHLWGVAADAVSYRHEVDEALSEAADSGGAAILLRPVSVDTVLGLARQGVRMPRKSTSFGPKPRSGLILRVFETA